MGGAAANNPNEGVTSSEQRNEDGSTTYTKTVTDAQGQSTTTRYTERGNPNGSQTRTEQTVRPDGYTIIHMDTSHPNDKFSTVYRRETVLNPQGETVYQRTRTRGGEAGRSDMEEGEWPSHINRTQDPNSDSYSPEFANWAKQFDHSAKKGAPEINRVNPGPEGATPNPQAPRIVPGEDQLVINPDPNNVSGQGRLPDADRYRQQLQDKVRGPGGHPGDDPEVNVPK